MRKALALAVLVVGAVIAPTAGAATVPTTFPAGFAVPTDASLGVPVIGFGAAGPVARTPVILLHGNNDTPFPTLCNPFGYIHGLAQYLLDHGYAASELWGLGYQGAQCDLGLDPTIRSSASHSTVANVADLREFVHAVRAFTGSKRVDIVGHSLGVTLAREWMRQDHANHLVRRVVAIDGPNHGIINCSPNPANYFQLPAAGGFTPDSAICREYGAADTPFLSLLNRGREAHGPTDWLTIRNADRSFVYFSLQDGPFFPPVPAEDRNGHSHDFSESARLEGARNVDLTGQGIFDPILGTAHLGILNSPQTWAATLAWLAASEADVHRR